MKIYRKTLTWLIFSALICGYTIAADPNTPAAEPNTPPHPVDSPDPNTVLVTVNAVEITQGQVTEKIKPQLDRMSAEAPANIVESIKAQLQQQALEQIIIEMLLDKKVKEQNIVITEEEATNQITEMASQQQPPLSLDDLKALMEASGQNFETVKKQVQKSMAYQKLIDNGLEDLPDVNEAYAKDYYDNNPEQFHSPEQVRASHILIEFNNTDPNLEPNEVKARALEKARQVQEKLQAGGDFALLAKEYSSCPSGANGGDLNYFTRGRMVPAFEEAAFALQIGQTSDIVETSFGMHIIKLTDRKPEAQMSFDEVKERLILSLKQRRQAEFAEQYVQELKQKAQIVYATPEQPDTTAPEQQKEEKEASTE